MAIFGVGMAPRGEVVLIVGSLGLSLGAIPTSILGVVVVTSLLTTVVCHLCCEPCMSAIPKPPFLRRISRVSAPPQRTAPSPAARAQQHR
jgi:Kef-type K+ transport system membrane component KefB